MEKKIFPRRELILCRYNEWKKGIREKARSERKGVRVLMGNQVEKKGVQGQKKKTREDQKTNSLSERSYEYRKKENLKGEAQVGKSYVKKESLL